MTLDVSEAFSPQTDRKRTSLCWTHLHEVLLQQAVDPRLGHLHGPHLVGDVAALDQHHLQLQREHHRVSGGGYDAFSLRYT